MPARYLKTTTMDWAQRTVLRVMLPPKTDAAASRAAGRRVRPTQNPVETLMGRRAPSCASSTSKTPASPAISTFNNQEDRLG
jgi:hypothetical protein